MSILTSITRDGLPVAGPPPLPLSKIRYVLGCPVSGRGLCWPLNWTPGPSSKKKPKLTLVGSGKLKLHEGQTKPLLMYLNKAGKELLKQQGKLDIQATVTVTSTGQAPVTSKKTIHVVLAGKKKKKH